jgi:hypothetical protein
LREPPRSPNRRIGDRVAVDPIPVTFVLDRGQRRLLRRRPVEIPGQLVDVSVSGAAIEAPSSPLLIARTRVLLEVHGTVSTVKVIRVIPGAGRGVSVYGVAWLQLDAALSEELYAVLGDGRPNEEAWFRAR